MEEDFAAMPALKAVCGILPANRLMCRASVGAVLDPLGSPPLGQKILSAMQARMPVIRVLLATQDMLIT
jgi:hypothetical protein